MKQNVRISRKRLQLLLDRITLGFSLLIPFKDFKCYGEGGGEGGGQPRPQGFSLKKWVGREKALASAGHVHSLNIPEKLIYLQPAWIGADRSRRE